MTEWEVGKTLLKGRIRLLGVTLACLLLTAAIKAMYPLAYGAMIDSATKSYQEALRFAGILLVLGISQAVIWAWTDSAETSMVESIGARARKLIVAKAHELPPSFFADEAQTTLRNRLDSDVGTLMQALQSTLLPVFQAILTLATSLAAMANLDWRLMLVSLTMVIPWFFMYLPFDSKMKSMSEAAVRERDSMSELIVSFLTHEGLLRTRVAAAAQSTSIRLFAAIDRLASASREKRRAARFPFALLWSGESLSMTCIAVVGLWLVAHHRSTPGSVVAFLSFRAIISQPLATLSTMQLQTVDFRVALRRIGSILSYQIPVRVNATAPPSGDIAILGASYSYYGASSAIADISLAFPDTAKVAIVGSTGSGKSTLLKIMQGLLQPLTGSVKYGNIPIEDLEDNVRASIFSFSADALGFFPGSIRDNLTTFRSIDDTVIDASLRSACADDFINVRNGALDDVVGPTGKSYSTGQLQRLSLARALVASSRVLVLDEPTSALDPRTEKRIFENLANLEVGVVVATHNALATMNFDLVAVLHEGQLCEFGSPSELRKIGGFYHQLLQSQMEQVGCQTRSADVA